MRRAWAAKKENSKAMKPKNNNAPNNTHGAISPRHQDSGGVSTGGCSSHEAETNKLVFRLKRSRKYNKNKN